MAGMLVRDAYLSQNNSRDRRFSHWFAFFIPLLGISIADP